MDGLAELVKQRRTALRLKQVELADLAGVSERFVLAVERGKTSVQLDKLELLLTALGLHLTVQRGKAQPRVPDE